ncbi:hypothetical protein CJP74_07695 [Psittacicella melopsittaci]|uniref:Uncharacterized protein n=1 Tax=Psittacicella melopsittaci TaxID=2028576 RepID=A0A3A1Y5F7_9GAMM|nr:SIR2 family protein [Psittacicella melopsittaci]RIY31274.1 hypothetical protein CJP74_07695 [Psittacicella melopsittaci]
MTKQDNLKVTSFEVLKLVKARELNSCGLNKETTGSETDSKGGELAYNGSIEIIDMESSYDDCLNELNRFFNQSLNSENLVVLAGSGTSLTFNKPGTNIAPSMRSLWELCSQHKDFDSVLDIIGNKNINHKEEKDIELLLSICDSIVENKFTDETSLETIENFIKSAKSTILEETNFVDNKLKNSEQANNNYWTHHDKFIRILSKRSDKQERLKLFTTNYDLAFEAAASNVGVIVIDGFEFTKPHRFNPSWYNNDIVHINHNDNKTEFLPNVMYLYKLHGSVDWVRNTKNNMIYKGNPLANKENQESVFIYPSRKKYQFSYSSPYLDMISAFMAVLQKPRTTLFCLGFGFHDAHLNNAIFMALRTNMSLNLVISTFNALDEEYSGINQEIRENLYELIKAGDGRIMIIDSKFDTFVDSIPDRNKETPEERLANSIDEILFNRRG